MSNSFKRLKSTGFTIVELLVVIIVIGILAAISVVAYNGVQKNALDKAVLSDVDGISGEVARYGTKNQGVYDSTIAWYSPSGVNSNISFVPSSGTVIDVVTNNTDYCIRGYNPASKTYTSLAFPSIIESTPGSCSRIGISASAQATNLNVNSGIVTTLAGSGVASYIDGNGTAAQFNRPAGVAVDSAGTVYVADRDNNRIRKITPAGVVTTLAGSGAYGSADGTGIAAQFNGPLGVAVDSSGTVYVADTYNNLIRKITPAGVVTTLAGSGAPGSTNGTGNAASFNTPYGVAVDSSGTIYVGDGLSYLVRKITPAGVVTTLAGSGVAGFTDGTGTTAQFNRPDGVAVDSSGTVYVADAYNHRIRKITPAGVVTTLAGSGVAGFTDGTGTTAQFNYPYGVAVDPSGTVYVADYATSHIRKITPAGVVTTLAGSGVQGFADGTGTAAQFFLPFEVAVDSSGTVYIADTYNNRIRKIQ